MGEACRRFNTPVTGGNVSFYNQSPDGPVYPTPTIGMVGLLESVDDMMTLGFKNEGDSIYLIGQSRNDISSSEYLHKIIGIEKSPCPHFDIEEEFAMQQTINALIKNKLIASAHDVSEGGLMVTLFESAFVNNLGFDVNGHEAGIRSDAYWFGEAQSRVVVSVSPRQQEAFLNFINTQQTSYSELGKVTKGDIKIASENWGSIHAFNNIYDNAIGNFLKAGEAEGALSLL